MAKETESFNTINLSNNSIVTNLQSLAKRICDDDFHLLQNFYDTLDEAVKQTFAILDSYKIEHESILLELENIAVTLWNKTVVMKMKGSLSCDAIAKLRHIAFCMVNLSYGCKKDDTFTRRLIMMGMKTVRAWLDSQKYEYAQIILDLVNRMTEIMYEQAVGSPTHFTTDSPECLAAQQDMFKLLCFKAEVFAGQDNDNNALDIVHKARQYLEKFSNETEHLSLMCYNFGEHAYRENRMSECSIWLTESFDIGRRTNGSSIKMQSQTLRLLANAYMELGDGQGCLEKALTTINQANNLCGTDTPNAAGLLLKLRILLKRKDTVHVIVTVVEELMTHSNVGLDLCHSVIQLLQQHSTDFKTCPLQSHYLNRFQNASGFGKLLTSYMELQLRIDIVTALKFTRDCIERSSECLTDAASRKRFHILLWEQAAQCYDDRNYSDALDWYNCSFDLFRPGEGLNDFGDNDLAKLHRNRANCYLGLHKMTQATEVLAMAKEIDPTSVYTYFLLYKVALSLSDVEKAKNSLRAMISNMGVLNPEEGCNVICLAAQIAIDRHHECIAAEALYSVLSHIQDLRQALKVLGCLVKLTVNELKDNASSKMNAVDKLISYIQKAYGSLSVLSSAHDYSIQDAQREAMWFMKTAWNTALNIENDHSKMKELFIACYHLLELCDKKVVNVGQVKSCLLMSVAISIQQARVTNVLSEQKTLLKEALQYVSEYNTIDIRYYTTEDNIKVAQPHIQGAVGSPQNFDERRVQELMLLYEFEALTKLNDRNADCVLERAMALPNHEIKMFETFAGLAMELPAHSPILCIKALKVVLAGHMQSEEPDFVKCSQIMHKLIDYCLKFNEDDAYAFFQEASDILNTSAANGSYPQMEIVWLVTKAWNTGIRHFCCEEFLEAERWCAFSMKLLPHMGSLRDSYEEHMMTVYTKILEGIDGQRSRGKLLEE